MADHAWPLDSQRVDLIRELARLIAGGGAWRFLRGPIVAADAASFPEPWDGTRVALAQVIARTLWHAHIDLAPELDDAREPAMPNTHKLRDTHIRLVATNATRVVMRVTALGNDDVAGIVAHEVGRAFVAGLDGGHPFRAAEHSEGNVPDPAIGSLATVCLGLGVLAANAAHHDRSAGDGQYLSTVESRIDHAGGLAWQDLAFLLAVQATVRDDVISALDSLRPSQAQELARWRGVLEGHKAELVAMLELSDSARTTAAARPSDPRPVTIRAATDEADLLRGNLGRPVFRFREGRTLAYTVAGFCGGTTTGVATAALTGLWPVLVVPLLAGTTLGWWYGRDRGAYRCATCRAFLAVDDVQCPTCGGRIAGEVRDPSERLEKEEELEREQSGGERSTQAARSAPT